MTDHRKTHPARNPLAQHLVRFGVLAAGVASVAAAAPAQASAPTTSPARSAVASDHTFTHADNLHHTQVKDSFTVRQFGRVNSADVRNQALAVSAGCSADAHCRSVAFSFQIVTLAGHPTHLNALNLSDAANQHCTGCQTLAGAYQFVVDTSKPIALRSDTQRKLADVHRRLDALARSAMPAADLKERVDALAAEVSGILHDAVAAAHTPETDGQPAVTVHRHMDGWPGH
ncbi:hypothetical protein [Streptomyces violascens]|uniref:hypothetical protein n=1 Tax=Streptomyces violascens TaxID=67381 RepID=UPI0036A1D6C3